MTEKVIRTAEELQKFMRTIQDEKLPLIIDVRRVNKRSLGQNRLQRLWMNEISQALGDRTPEEVRGYCKLSFGVPILRESNEAFRERYDRILKPLGYQDKLELMMEPIDLAVTRIMTPAQAAEYLDRIIHHFNQQGIILTLPEAA
tara:strand:- start:511 stop:945 length:435 start_codon:yes stop_codon:yes gene_type:complete